MRNKKRNKKYNKMNGALASARMGLRNVAVFHSQRSLDNEYTAHVINFKNSSQLEISPSMAHVLMNIRHKWNVHLIASGVESNGKLRFEVDEVPLIEPLLQSDLVDYLDWRHKELAEKFQEKNELTNVSWIACPNGDQLTIPEIDNILTKMDAY